MFKVNNKDTKTSKQEIDIEFRKFILTAIISSILIIMTLHYSYHEALSLTFVSGNHRDFL